MGMRQSTQTRATKREGEHLSAQRLRCENVDGAERSRRVLSAEAATPTLLGAADHRVVVAVGTVVVGLHLHSVLGAEHLGVLAVSQEVLVVLLQVPQGQPVLLHPQGLELHCTDVEGMCSVGWSASAHTRCVFEGGYHGDIPSLDDVNVSHQVLPGH